VLGIRIRMFLGIPDPDPLVRYMDTDPWADWNNACKIKFLHKIFCKNTIFKTEVNVPGML
jgi:hypothetical protein